MKQHPTIEGPTLAMAAVCYGLWALGTVWLPSVSMTLAIVVVALMITLHSSLQHEIIHGHPFGRPWLDALLVFPALGLFIPFERFRDTHLAHHRNERLTDPYDDPETHYLDPAVWARLPAPVRIVLRLNNTLAGRMALGPAIGLVVFYGGELALLARGDRAVWRAWALHVAAVAPVWMWLEAWGEMPLWAYGLAVYLGMAILRIRTFLEHRADRSIGGRSVIVEDRGPLALLFLNNNYHALHHMRPRVAWYRLPALYRQRRERVLAMNRGYRYRSYRAVFGRYLWRAKEPVPHPGWVER